MIDLTPEQWIEKIAKDSEAVVLDVRTAEEYNEGILENAQLLDYHQTAQFLHELEQMDPKKPYYVYCRSGNRSVYACLLMNKLGFKETYNLLGGIINWSGKIVNPHVITK